MLRKFVPKYLIISIITRVDIRVRLVRIRYLYPDHILVIQTEMANRSHETTFNRVMNCNQKKVPNDYQYELYTNKRE